MLLLLVMFIYGTIYSISMTKTNDILRRVRERARLNKLCEDIDKGSHDIGLSDDEEV